LVATLRGLAYRHGDGGRIGAGVADADEPPADVPGGGGGALAEGDEGGTGWGGEDLDVGPCDAVTPARANGLDHSLLHGEPAGKAPHAASSIAGSSALSLREAAPEKVARWVGQEALDLRDLHQVDPHPDDAVVIHVLDQRATSAASARRTCAGDHRLPPRGAGMLRVISTSVISVNIAAAGAAFVRAQIMRKISTASSQAARSGMLAVSLPPVACLLCACGPHVEVGLW
jgi:hypothetical protein